VQIAIAPVRPAANKTFVAARIGGLLWLASVSACLLTRYVLPPRRSLSSMTKASNPRLSTDEARCSKDHAAPVPRMPAITDAANDGRRYDCRCHDNRRRRYDYDRRSVRPTCSLRPTVKARTTSALGTGTVDGDK
jgi:hypothetical protein